MTSEQEAKGTYRIHDDPPVVTDDQEAIEAAKWLGYDVTEVTDPT